MNQPGGFSEFDSHTDPRDRPERQRQTMYESILTSDDDVTTSNNTDWWGLGTHADDPLNDRDLSVFESLMDSAEQVAPGMSDLLDQARSEARGMQVSGYQCPIEECGIQHSHSDTKHDVSGDIESSSVAGLSVRPEFVDNAFQTCPYCHCGVHNLLMLMDYRENFNQKIFTDEGEDDFSWSQRRTDVEAAARSAQVPDRVHNYVSELRAELESEL